MRKSKIELFEGQDKKNFEIEKKTEVRISKNSNVQKSQMVVNFRERCAFAELTFLNDYSQEWQFCSN